mmetsp:Transcript_2173/g.3477  ORF Transcript_2173/g.3477 Transcript_2173/m.3477 type:complete len:264 (+) Transcript_2173:238-1029(+)
MADFTRTLLSEFEVKLITLRHFSQLLQKLLDLLIYIIRNTTPIILLSGFQEVNLVHLPVVFALFSGIIPDALAGCSALHFLVPVSSDTLALVVRGGGSGAPLGGFSILRGLIPTCLLEFEVLRVFIFIVHELHFRPDDSITTRPFPQLLQQLLNVLRYVIREIIIKILFSEFEVEVELITISRGELRPVAENPPNFLRYVINIINIDGNSMLEPIPLNKVTVHLVVLLYNIIPLGCTEKGCLSIRAGKGGKKDNSCNLHGLVD